MTDEQEEIGRLRAQVESLQQQTVALARSEAAYRKLLAVSADVIMRFGLDARCTYASPSIYEVLGYLPEEHVGRSGFSIIHPDDMEMPRALREQALSEQTENDRSGPYLSRLLHKRGHYVWVESMLALLRNDETGALEEFVLTSRDVSARVEAEAALRASEHRFRSLVDGLQVGVIAQNRASEFVMYNQGALDLLDLTEEQLLGRTSFDPRWRSIHEDGSPFPGAEHPVMVAMATGRPVRDVTMGVYQPNRDTYVWLLISATPQFGRDGEVTQAVCTFTDITARKRAEEIVREQSALLEQLSTPIVPISDGVIALPLIGQIDARRASRVLDALLAGVATHRVRVAVLDITGVTQADAAFAAALTQVTRGVRLLGAELVITGMRAAIAQALVQLGLDLGDLVTRSTLQDAIAYALARRG